MLQCENVFRWIPVGKTSTKIDLQTDSNYLTLCGKNVTLRERKGIILGEKAVSFYHRLYDLSN